MKRQELPEKELIEIAKQIKRDIFLMAYHSGAKGAHIGGSLSCVELLTALYAQTMCYDISCPYADNRDRFIMSKAHCAIALYATLKYAGFLSQQEIETAMTKGSLFFKHPKMDISKGIEFSGGSLGQGLSLAVGGAIALRKRCQEAKFYVLLGDGELDEGSVWEAFSSIIQFQLNNVVTIIDRNGLQNDGKKEDIMTLGNLSKRFLAMGFSPLEINGHDFAQIKEAFAQETLMPKIILARTQKGNGISFAENKTEWHINYVNEELYEQARKEIG